MTGKSVDWDVKHHLKQKTNSLWNEYILNGPRVTSAHLLDYENCWPYKIKDKYKSVSLFTDHKLHISCSLSCKRNWKEIYYYNVSYDVARVWEF